MGKKKKRRRYRRAKANRAVGQGKNHAIECATFRRNKQQNKFPFRFRLNKSTNLTKATCNNVFIAFYIISSVHFSNYTLYPVIIPSKNSTPYTVKHSWATTNIVQLFTHVSSDTLTTVHLFKFLYCNFFFSSFFFCHF